MIIYFVMAAVMATAYWTALAIEKIKFDFKQDLLNMAVFSCLWPILLLGGTGMIILMILYTTLNKEEECTSIY